MTTLDLYHRTSEDAARAIVATGRFLTRENTPEAYVSTHVDGEAAGYGSAVVHVRVDEADAQLVAQGALGDERGLAGRKSGGTPRGLRLKGDRRRRHQCSPSDSEAPVPGNGERAEAAEATRRSTVRSIDRNSLIGRPSE